MPKRFERRLPLALILGLSASACASVTPPPRFGAHGPADPGSPATVERIPAPILTEGGELAEPPEPKP